MVSGVSLLFHLGFGFPAFMLLDPVQVSSQMGAGSSGLGGESVRRPRGDPHRRPRGGAHPGHTATSCSFQASLRAVQMACSDSSSGQRSVFLVMVFSFPPGGLALDSHSGGGGTPGGLRIPAL